VEQSLQNHRHVQQIAIASITGGRHTMDAADIVTAARRYGNHLGVEFGAVYDSPAIAPDGTAAPVVPDPYSDYLPSARPGCRAPHAWLGRGEASLSTLDLPVACYAIGEPGLEDRDDVFFARYGIEPSGAC
jgi:putative polyketide hydroxylase